MCEGCGEMIEDFLAPIKGRDEFKTAGLALRNVLTIEQIAKIQGISATTVRQRIARANERLGLIENTRTQLFIGYIEYLEAQIDV